MTNSSSIRLMEHAATLDLEDFENAEFQDQLERARRQTSGRMTLMGQMLSQAQDLVTVASFAAGLVIYAPWLIALLLLALVPAFLGEAHFNAQSYSLDFGRTPERREMDYVRQTAASNETAKEVKIFDLHGFLIERYVKLATAFYAANRRLALGAPAGAGCSPPSAPWAITRLTPISPGRRLPAHSRWAILLFWRVRSGACARFSKGCSPASPPRRARRSISMTCSPFLRSQPEIMSPENPLPFPKPIAQGFVFEDVGFKYPGAERWAVRGLSFTLKAGEVVALVGENGAGKTTLVKLLARLYDPDEGRILLDGHDLRDYDLDALRGNMGVIFQDFVRYNLSAADNIAVGMIEERDDRPRIMRAAERSQADEVIARLPGGYDQMIGKRFKKGVELSGGEWQKMAIARAYMREAQVLILDEPTAALDARAEFEVFKRFKELSAGKTAVLISHRFSSVRMADRILVLAEGQVEAAGTHEELIAQPGRYSELFELQAAGYR